VQETHASKRFTIVDTEDYTVDLEYNNMYAILHLPRVSKFNKTVYTDMKIKVQDIWDFVQTVGYSGMWICISKEDTTLGKFVQKIGFNFLGSYETQDVYEYGGER
jgi:hypothetical protein